MAHGAVHRHKNLSIQAICMQIARIKIKEASISKRDVCRFLLGSIYSYLCVWHGGGRALCINYKVNLESGASHWRIIGKAHRKDAYSTQTRHKLNSNTHSLGLIPRAHPAALLCAPRRKQQLLLPGKRQCLA